MYQIIIKKKAKKFIDWLPANERRRVVAAIEQLPNGEDIKRLKGHDNLLRLRVAITALSTLWTMGNLSCMSSMRETKDRYITTINAKGREKSRPFFLTRASDCTNRSACDQKLLPFHPQWAVSSYFT